MSVLSPREALDYWRDNIPYSPREALKVIDALCDATKGSDMVVMPGTMMVYTQSDRLYNVMPVVSNGKLIYSVLKYVNGGSSDFALGGLKFESGRERGAVFEHGGIKFGVEICADRGAWEASWMAVTRRINPTYRSCRRAGPIKRYGLLRKTGIFCARTGADKKCTL
jgi:predicted amidohydrolase